MKTTIYSRSKGYRVDITIQLTVIGKQEPYFSITGEVYSFGKKGRPRLLSCGCVHDYIQALTNKYDDIIALHLSNKSGIPMYAVENGFYWLEQKNWGALARHLRMDEDVVELMEGMTKEKFRDFVYGLYPSFQDEANKAIIKYQLV